MVFSERWRGLIWTLEHASWNRWQVPFRKGRSQVEQLVSEARPEVHVEPPQVVQEVVQVSCSEGSKILIDSFPRLKKAIILISIC